MIKLIQTISKDGKVVCVTSVPYDSRTIKAMKKGELPPKKKSKLSKRRVDALLAKRIRDITGITAIQNALGNSGRFY